MAQLPPAGGPPSVSLSTGTRHATTRYAEQNVSDPERWLSVVIGSALAAYGLKKRSIGGLVIALGGAFSRRHRPLRRLRRLRLSTAEERNDDNVSVPYGRGIRVEKSRHHRRRRKSSTRSGATSRTCRASCTTSNRSKVHRRQALALGREGPAGIDVEWDAEIINEIPNELIGWRSVDGSRVDNAGSVHFKPTPDGAAPRSASSSLRPARRPLGAAIARSSSARIPRIRCRTTCAA